MEAAIAKLLHSSSRYYQGHWKMELHTMHKNRVSRRLALSRPTFVFSRALTPRHCTTRVRTTSRTHSAKNAVFTVINAMGHAPVNFPDGFNDKWREKPEVAQYYMSLGNSFDEGVQGTRTDYSERHSPNPTLWGRLTLKLASLL